jgi:osmotically-inducible protein OsmY
MPHDRALQEAVLTQLGWEPSIDAGHIGVTADEGVVTLTGHVENFLQKRTAEKAAAGVRGVRAVVKELRVRMPLPLQHGDEEIAKVALHRLEWEANVPADDVMVEVDTGWVTLSGEVEWHFQREAAERVLRGMAGVVGILNEIAVQKHSLATGIAAEIGAALHRSQFDAEAVVVSDDDGVITLTGTVANLTDSETACQTAWKARGTASVKNDLVVA